MLTPVSGLYQKCLADAYPQPYVGRTPKMDVGEDEGWSLGRGVGQPYCGDGAFGSYSGDTSGFSVVTAGEEASVE